MKKQNYEKANTKKQNNEKTKLLKSKNMKKVSIYVTQQFFCFIGQLNNANIRGGDVGMSSSSGVNRKKLAI